MVGIREIHEVTALKAKIREMIVAADALDQRRQVQIDNQVGIINRLGKEIDRLQALVDAAETQAAPTD